MRGLLEAVRSSAFLVDGQVQGSLGSLRALGASKAIARGDLQAAYDEAHALDEAGEVWTVLLDERGRQVFNTSKPFGATLLAPPIKDVVGTTWASSKPVVTDLFVGPVSGTLHTMFYVPAAGPGGAHWALGQAFSAERWNRTVLQPVDRPNWVVAVVDHQGKIIARSVRGQELVGKMARPQLVDAAGTEASGVLRHRTLDDVDAYVAFDHSSATGWTIAIGAPAGPIDGLARRSVSLLAGGVLAALLTGALAALAIGRRIVGALSAATSYAVAIDSDRPTALAPRTGVREVDSLNLALAAKSRKLGAERVAREAVEEHRAALLAEQTQARARAERDNAAKDRFVAQLGHEIRNPMAAITGSTDVLSRISEARPPIRSVRGDHQAPKRTPVPHRRRSAGRVAHVVGQRHGSLQRPRILRILIAECADAMRATGAAQHREIREHTCDVSAVADAGRLEQAVGKFAR